MISRRTFAAALGALALGGGRAARAADAAGTPVVVIREFYDVLLGVMKDGSRLGFAGRRERLAPAIRRAYDFPLMTQLMVGPQWLTLAADQQQQLIAAFGAFSIATYANRFDDYSGESFAVDDATKQTNAADVIVDSQLIKSDGDKVELDYLMRQNGTWKVIDVYLSGTVSELTTRRSEFTSVMRRGGAAALVELLQRKVVELSS